MKIPSLQADKLAHYLWAASLRSWACWTAGSAPRCCALPWPWAVGREVYNARTSGLFDWRDILATCLGGTAVVVSFLVGSA